MTKINLKSKIRDVVGRKVKKFREEGLIPAVMYGHKIKPQNLWVNYLDFKKVFQKAGESTVIELDLENDKKCNVLIHEIQSDPLTQKFSHIDFFQIRMDEEIETEIPVEFIGESAAIKELGGMLVKNIDAIPVKCFPADLPSKFEVDISKIKTFDDHIQIKDLEISDKVKLMIEPETVIALVEAPRSEEELASLEEKVIEDVSQVEGVVKEASEAVPEEEAKKEEK
jgi:large subunit ribosomal protein L25